MSRPHSHLFEVEASFPAAGDALVVCLPVWTPGSYLVREYSRHVQEFIVVDAGGKPVAFERIDKRSYRIVAGNQPVTCRYKVYANELTVRTSHLDGTHGFFNGAIESMDFVDKENVTGGEVGQDRRKISNPFNCRA